MAVDIANLNYVPTLAIRASEMNGLERLPAATKDRIQPLFLLAPWPNANELMKAIDRVERAFPDRPYFLDIDRDYQVTNSDAPAQVEWKDLQDPANNYGNWVGFIESIPASVSPCLQIAGVNEPQIISQIHSFQEMGRTFAFRVEMRRFPSNLDAIISGINAVGSADYVVVVDAGWIADTQPTKAAIAHLIRDQFGDIDAQVPIIVSYTTIPKGFADVEGVDFVQFDNREFIDELRLLTNRQAIVFGDWASTRPRENGIASRPKPRIDLSLRNGWLSARNKPEEWDYSDAAKEILENPAWQQIKGMGIWGAFMVEQTAVNQAVGINSPQKNVAARVNIHLHNQAFFDVDDPKSINLDEAWHD